MPTFDTSEPISVTVELLVGDVRIMASERTDTVVEVLPSDETDESDAKAARQTRVEYANGTLLVGAPKTRALDFFGKNRSVDVTIELPAGSRVHSTTAVGDFRCVGQLGECRVKTSTGHIQLGRTGPLDVKTAAGNVTVDRVVGQAEVTTESGKLRIGELDGPAVLKNSNGSTHIGTTTGEVRMRTANGDIALDHAAAGIDAKTANGNIRIGEVGRGSVVLQTSIGDIEVEIGEGTVAWLDVNTKYGRVHNSLDTASAGPGRSEEAVDVRAHTAYGDITVRRC